MKRTMAQTPKDWQFYDRKLAEHLGVTTPAKPELMLYGEEK